MNKVLMSGVLISALLIVALIFVATPSLTEPNFIVANDASESVYVTAHWREKEKEIGLVEPHTEVSFSVNDEAAMRFSAKYENGRVTESEEIYFTSGYVVKAKITYSGISVKYDFDT